MPSSITATRCAARRRSSVSGTPISLLRLPRVASTASSPKCARRIAAIISFTVVLPLLPATRRAAARSARARPRPARPSAPADRRPRSGSAVAAQALRALGGDQRRDGAARQRRGDEVVAVEALALERDEQVAGLQARACRWSRAGRRRWRRSAVPADRRARRSSVSIMRSLRDSESARHVLGVGKRRGARRRSPGRPRGPCRRSARRRPRRGLAIAAADRRRAIELDRLAAVAGRRECRGPWR